MVKKKTQREVQQVNGITTWALLIVIQQQGLFATNFSDGSNDVKRRSNHYKSPTTPPRRWCIRKVRSLWWLRRRRAFRFVEATSDFHGEQYRDIHVSTDVYAVIALIFYQGLFHYSSEMSRRLRHDRHSSGDKQECGKTTTFLSDSHFAAAAAAWVSLRFLKVFCRAQLLLYNLCAACGYSMRCTHGSLPSNFLGIPRFCGKTKDNLQIPLLMGWQCTNTSQPTNISACTRTIKFHATVTALFF